MGSAVPQHVIEMIRAMALDKARLYSPTLVSGPHFNGRKWTVKMAGVYAADNLPYDLTAYGEMDQWGDPDLHDVVPVPSRR